MATSFECINDNDIVQIDDENKAFSLIDVRTVTLVDYSGVIYAKFTLTTTAMPLIAVRNLGTGTAICSGVKAVSGGYEVTIIGDTAVQVRVYSFGLVPINQSNYGLQLFNASGEITFDALSKWIKVVKTFLPSTPHYPPNLPFPDYYYEDLPDSNKTYAIAACSLKRFWKESAFWSDNYWDGEGSCYVHAIKVVNNQAILGYANTVHWTIHDYDSNVPGDQDFYENGDEIGTSLFLLLDVTGY